MLRSTVLQRDKERAERATLVAQEKLVRGKVRQASTTVRCLGCTCAPAGSYKFNRRTAPASSLQWRRLQNLVDMGIRADYIGTRSAD